MYVSPRPPSPFIGVTLTHLDNKPRDWRAATTWEQKLNELVFSLDNSGQPRFRDFVWPDVFESQRGKELFSTPIGEEKFLWTTWLTDNAIWLRLNTLSQIAVLQGREREAFVEKVHALLLEPDVERNERGEVALHGTTYFAWTTRLD